MHEFSCACVISFLFSHLNEMQNEIEKGQFLRNMRKVLKEQNFHMLLFLGFLGIPSVYGQTI